MVFNGYENIKKKSPADSGGSYKETTKQYTLDNNVQILDLTQNP